MTGASRATVGLGGHDQDFMVISVSESPHVKNQDDRIMQKREREKKKAPQTKLIQNKMFLALNSSWRGKTRGSKVRVACHQAVSW